MSGRISKKGRGQEHLDNSGGQRLSGKKGFRKLHKPREWEKYQADNIKYRRELVYEHTQQTYRHNCRENDGNHAAAGLEAVEHVV